MIPTRTTPHPPQDNKNNNNNTQPLPPTPFFKPFLRNFRKAAGLSKIYRCASTDVLGTLLLDQQQQRCEPTTPSSSSSISFRQFPPSSPEAIVLNHIGLVLDLRSSRERNEDLVRRWTSHAHGGPFRVVALYCHDGTLGDGCEPKKGGFLEEFCTNDGVFKDSVESKNDGNMYPGCKPNKGNQHKRTVLQIDILNRKRLVRWYEKQNRAIPENNGGDTNGNPSPLTQPQNTQLSNTIHRLGLMGLYQCILETSGEDIRRALVAVTEYLESLSQQQQTGVGGAGGVGGGGVVVHCVQGKDRTGLVIMLCQSIMGVEDSVIIEDYHKSDGIEVSSTTTKKLMTGAVSVMEAAATTPPTTTTKTRHNNIHNNSWKTNRELSSAAPRETMVTTLVYLREKYGSVEDYLDSVVGFDGDWRNRFVDGQKRLLGSGERRGKEVAPLGLLPWSRF